MSECPTRFDFQQSVAATALPERRASETFAEYVLRLVDEEADKARGQAATDKTLRALEARVLELLRLLEAAGVIRAADGGQFEVAAIPHGTRYNASVTVRIYPAVLVLSTPEVQGTVKL